VQHWWQVQQQCGVFAAPGGWIARWNGRGYRSYWIPFDPDRYAAAGKLAREFLDDVAAGREPDPDAHTTTTAVLKRLHPGVDYRLPPVQVPRDWGEDRDALTVSRAEIDKEIRKIDNMIRGRIGDAASGYDMAGRVYSRTIRARKGYTVKPGTTDSITTTPPLEDL
jgi:hypothetical protein